MNIQEPKIIDLTDNKVSNIYQDYHNELVDENELTLDCETWNEIVYDVYEIWKNLNKENHREFYKELWECDDYEFDEEFCYGGMGYDVFTDTETNKSLVEIKKHFDELSNKFGYEWV